MRFGYELTTEHDSTLVPRVVDQPTDVPVVLGTLRLSVESHVHSFAVNVDRPVVLDCGWDSCLPKGPCPSSMV